MSTQRFAGKVMVVTGAAQATMANRGMQYFLEHEGDLHPPTARRRGLDLSRCT